MNVHSLLHAPFEGLAEIEPWLSANGHHLTSTCLFDGDPLPDVSAPSAPDWLIVMGGPMNVYEHRTHPFLRDEKRFIELFIATGRRVLGICFGAQLIADVLGAKVYQNPEKEIGWHPVSLLPGAKALFGLVADPFEVFHWHGDTFDLPAGATLMAGTQACPHQAFTYGDHVTALQFHLEMNTASIAGMLDHCQSDLTTGPFVQSPSQILRPSPPQTLTALHHVLQTIAA